MMLRMQLFLCVIDVENQLAVLDPLPRLRIGG